MPTATRRLRGLILVAACVLAATLSAPAFASEPLADFNVKNVKLAVNQKGEALLTYNREDGTLRHVLVWGAINAHSPSATVPQVRFSYDYAGGWGRYHKLYWKTFRNSCRRYDGPPLVDLVVACKAPDGSYWALQSWQRGLPLLGFEPWLKSQSAFELHISHWSGDLPELDVSPHWTYGASSVGLFGRLLYAGSPVYGFKATAVGNPLGRYERNVYIDTYDSAYGSGWKRESGILTHKPSGSFCHSFVAQQPFPGYPSQAMRPAAPGSRYRVTVMGPGVTPVIQWEGAGLGAFDASKQTSFTALFDQWMVGDAKCAPER